MTPSDPIRPFYYSDAGVRTTLEALRSIALDEDTKLKHESSGVTLDLNTPGKRLSVIAGALESVIDHLRERDEGKRP